MPSRIFAPTTFSVGSARLQILIVADTPQLLVMVLLQLHGVLF
jgi:hypothetical protein